MSDEKLVEIFKSLPKFAENLLLVKPKSGGSLVPFKLNRAQMFAHERLEAQLRDTGMIRALVCKGRQMGFSTLVQARFLLKTVTNKGITTFILTHESEATKNLFRMTKSFYESVPKGILPACGSSSVKELTFPTLRSGYSVGTAGNEATGRSQTIQLMHGCLAQGTLVFNPQTGGLRPIESFVVGELIKTHTGAIAPISFVSSQQKHCVQVVMRGLTKFPLIATPEHKFFTKIGWKELKELKIGDAIGYPIQKIDAIKDEVLLPEAPKRAHGGGRQFVCPDTLEIDYNFGRVLGLYLADGHVKLAHKAPNNPSCICFTVHRKEVARTIEWLDPFSEYFSSIKVNHKKNSLTSTVICYGNRFASLVNNLCGRVETKRCPIDWHLYGKDFCKGLLHGYLAGDGASYIDDRRIRATSIHSSITISMRDITASLGYGWASVEHKSAALRNSRNEKEAFIFSLCGDGATRLACEIDKPSPARKRNGTVSIKNHAANTTEISNGYAWLRIKEIADAGMKQVYDFEVSHEDHSYCIINGAASNSEVAYWPNAEEHAKGVLEAVPREPGTEIILESTANGIGNYFHSLWIAAITGKSNYQAIFLPWYWDDKYTIAGAKITLDEDEEQIYETHKGNGLTIEHLAWRREKLNASSDREEALERFKQEYPLTWMEAFRSPVANRFIKANLVEKARKNKVETNSPLVIGVDPAISDNDRLAIIRRRGRRAYNLETYYGMNTMEIVGLVRRIIDSERPAKVCIDCIGIGAGVVDRLLELGYTQVEGVNVAHASTDKERYRNKRAELWGEMKDWLENEMGVEIPDSDELQGDLTAPGYKYDSSNRLLIESKDDMKKRGMKSPDCAESLMLTFSVGEYVNTSTYTPIRLPEWSKGMLT